MDYVIFDLEWNQCPYGKGKEDTVKKQKRFHSEMQLFQSRWVDILATGDPYYNMNLALDAFDFSVRK